MHEVEVVVPTTSEKDDESDEGDDDYDDDEVHYPNWQLPEDEKLFTGEDDISSEEESEIDCSTPDSEKKFIVFESSLNKLLKRCPDCGDVITECKRKTTGSMLSIELTCNSGHTLNWDSQPVVKRKPLGNLLLSAAILFTGNTFTAISQFASCFHLQFFSESVFYDGVATHNKQAQVVRKHPFPPVLSQAHFNL